MTDNFAGSLFARPQHGRRVLICVRGNCAHPDFGSEIYQRLETLIQKHGLDDPDHPDYVTCRTTHCLGVCEKGPVMIIHPEAIRYQQVDAVRLEKIFREHLLQRRPIEDWIVQYPKPRKI